MPARRWKSDVSTSEAAHEIAVAMQSPETTPTATTPKAAFDEVPAKQLDIFQTVAKAKGSPREVTRAKATPKDLPKATVPAPAYQVDRKEAKAKLKTLRQIEALEEKQKQGEKLDSDQLAKIAKKAMLEAELRGESVIGALASGQSAPSFANAPASASAIAYGSLPAAIASILTDVDGLLADLPNELALALDVSSEKKFHRLKKQLVDTRKVLSATKIEKTQQEKHERLLEEAPEIIVEFLALRERLLEMRDEGHDVVRLKEDRASQIKDREKAEAATEAATERRRKQTGSITDEYGLPSRGRFSHFSNRLGHRVRPQIAPHDDRTECELITMEGGATTVAWALHSAEPKLRIGLMLAANGGRPGGSCGTPTGVAAIHPGHRTQEEDLMSNWMITEAGDDKESQDRLFAETIAGQWGMLEIGTTGKRTIQGVDYTTAVNPSAYSDAWVVRDASVSAKTSASSIPSFDLQRQAPCTLVFVAGPNAGCRGTREGSMSRTLNVRASRTEEYEFFRESVAAGIRAGLDAMVNEGVEVALLAKLSCGIYAGPHRNRINAEDSVSSVFQEVVESVLHEELCGQRRGQYFKRVIVPLLP